MTPTLRAFTAGLIDYAGLFPPARLSMSDATATFERHRASEFDWMLSSFVCPVDRLGELADEQVEKGRRKVLPTSVLGNAPVGLHDLLERADADAEIIEDIAEEGSIEPIQLEVWWPHDLIDYHAISRYGRLMSSVVNSLEYIFLEIDRTETWDTDVVRMADALREANGPYGLKIRTGGLKPDDYPDSSQIATGIRACSSARVPMKATAGLHHPIRHDRLDEGVTQHGFVNVFGAAAFSCAIELDQEVVVAMLEERDIAAFRFDKDRFCWRDLSIDLPDLESARSALAVSFGSCSFDEPLEDLQAAGLL